MYLTEELFEAQAADVDHSYYSPVKQAMDHHQHSPESLGKRKRSAGEEYTANTVPFKNIKICPAPSHCADCPTHCFPDYPPSSMYPVHAAAQTSPTARRKHHHNHHHFQHRIIAQPRSFFHSSSTSHRSALTRGSVQAMTTPADNSNNNNKTNQPSRTNIPSAGAAAATAAPAAAPSSSSSTTDLTPCHCCQRGPKQKKELDGFAACAECGLRTCYICMRVCEQCGDPRRICRGCCVERGVEGETWCLQCMQAEGGDVDTVMG